MSVEGYNLLSMCSQALSHGLIFDLLQLQKLKMFSITSKSKVDFFGLLFSRDDSFIKRPISEKAL